MTSEREALVKYFNNEWPNLAPSSYGVDGCDGMDKPFQSMIFAAFQKGVEYQAARQDWPSEDEAVEIMANAIFDKSDGAHIHAAGDVDMDACAICGKDIRNEIHIGFGENSFVKTSQIQAKAAYRALRNAPQDRG